MTRAALLSICAAALFLPLPAGAADLVIGVAAPASGPMASLGAQLLDGAEAAAAELPGDPVTLATADDACTAEGGAEAARRLIADNVAVVVGFLCTEAIEAALPLLSEAHIPVVTPGVRANALTDQRHKTHWPVYRLAPRADAEAAAVGSLLTSLWRDGLFAIVDDGTIYGRELAESLRLAAEMQGLKPVFTDTYRPQMDNQIGLVGRLRRAGAAHVFVGGDREDIAVIGRDAEKLGVALEIAGGEALRAAPGPVPLAAGTLMIGLPDGTATAPPAVLERLGAEGVAVEGYVLPGYAALQIAAAALGADGDAAQNLAAFSFATVLGDIRFDDKGDRAGNPYRLFRFDGTRFVEVD